jgi:hypothetical protein
LRDFVSSETQSCRYLTTQFLVRACIIEGSSGPVSLQWWLFLRPYLHRANSMLLARRLPIEQIEGEDQLGPPLPSGGADVENNRKRFIMARVQLAIVPPET